MPDEIKGYSASTPTVSRLLGDETIAFDIPSFQRSYSWGRSQIDELMSDLYEFDEHWLSDDVKEDPYFLGAIVLAGKHVLDGQQRLATMSLLLAVLSERLRMAGEDTTAIERCLSSKELGGPKTFKVSLQTSDQWVFEHLLQAPASSADPKSGQPTGLNKKMLGELKRHELAAATRRIISAIDGAPGEPGLLMRAEQRGIGVKAAMTRMAQRAIYGVWFVVISAVDEAAAFRLFETLNDRGLDLSAADLVKNKLLERSGAYRTDVEEIWKDIVDAVGGELVDFLRHYWIAFHELVRHEQLYERIRKHVETLPPEGVRAFVTVLRDAARNYEDLADPDPKRGTLAAQTVEVLERLLAYRSRSCRPPLLVAASLGDDVFARVARAAETVSIRHTLVGDRNRNVIERTYSVLALSIRENGSDADLVKIVGAIMPDDQQFQQDFESLDVRTPTAAWREVLVRLNDDHYVATGETKTAGSGRVHVEHVLPTNPSPDALKESGFDVDEESDARVYARRIGNLTLLAGNKNQAASNSAFSKKLPILKSSKIAMNKSITSDASGADRSVWDRSAIDHRAKELASAAVKLWPWPPA